MTLTSKLLKTILNSLFVLVCCLDFFLPKEKHTILPVLLFKTACRDLKHTKPHK